MKEQGLRGFLSFNEESKIFYISWRKLGRPRKQSYPNFFYPDFVAYFIFNFFFLPRPMLVIGVLITEERGNVTLRRH